MIDLFLNNYLGVLTGFWVFSWVLMALAYRVLFEAMDEVNIPMALLLVIVVIITAPVVIFGAVYFGVMENSKHTKKVQ